MTTLSPRTPRLTAPGQALPGAALWASAAVALGAGLGLAAGLQQTTLAVAIVALPALVALLLHPDWIAPVLVASTFGEALSTSGLTVSRFAGPLALLIILLALPARKGPRLPRIGVLVAAAAYSAWALASVLWTVNPSSSFHLGGTGYVLTSLALSIVYMLAIVMFVRREEDVWRLAVVIWVFSVGAGLVAIGQYLGGYTRAVALSGDPNLFASLQVVALPIGAVLVGQARNTRMRLIVLAGLAVTVGSIMTSLSRGGILTLAVAFLLISIQPASAFFHTKARKRAFLLVAAVGAGLLLFASYSALSARTSSLFTTYDGGSGRTNLWLAAMTGWREHPVIGMGYGAFIGQSNQLLVETPGVDFSGYQLRPTGQVAHSAYIESLAELGVVGLGLFVGLLVTIGVTLLSTARRAARAGAMFLASFTRACLVALVAFAFASLFLSTETARILWILAGLSVALPGVLLEWQRRQGSVSETAPASATVVSPDGGRNASFRGVLDA